MAYRTKFDAKAYWANKPLCIVCKKHKVKNGTTCHECRKLEEKTSKQLPKEKSGHKPIIEMNTENIEEKNTENNAPNENFGISSGSSRPRVRSSFGCSAQRQVSRRLSDILMLVATYPISSR